MDLQLRDKVVIVHRRRQWNWRAITKTFATEGAIPVMVDRDADRGERFVAELRGRISRRI